MERSPWSVAIAAFLYRASLYLSCPDVDRKDRARMVHSLREVCLAAHRVGGPSAVLRLRRPALTDTDDSTRDENAWMQRQQERWGKDGHVNIHDPRVHGESGATLKKALQALCCVALMQLCITATVGAEQTGSTILEAITVAVLAASIVGCLVTTAREAWAMGRLGKALLDSAR